MLPKSHPYHTHITSTQHPYHIYITHIPPTSHYIHITSSHSHHIHITSTHHIHIPSSYLHHLHHIYITSIIISSHVHHQHHTYITPTSHQDHIKITCTSLPYHTLHHIYTTPPQWHHHHAQSHLMRESHHIQKSSVAHLWTRDIIPFTLVANMDCQMHQARPYKDPSISSKMFQHHLFQSSTTST